MGTRICISVRNKTCYRCSPSEFINRHRTTWYLLCSSTLPLRLSIGAGFAIIGGFVQWFPLFTGLPLNPKWLKAQFVVIFAEVNVIFFPQHCPGLAGIHWRYPDYPDAYNAWNIILSIGSIVSFVSVIIFLFIIWERSISNRLTNQLTYTHKKLGRMTTKPPTNRTQILRTTNYFIK
jgi:heme/copper-type cytochrome/quinol oxidase subunit 1